MTTLRLTGHDLSISEVVAVSRGGDIAVALDRAAEHRVVQAAKVVAEVAKDDVPVYGVNTGFGEFCMRRKLRPALLALEISSDATVAELVRAGRPRKDTSAVA